MTLYNLSGTILGQYELQELIGTGRLGAVYRAYQPDMHREVAIRLLPPTSYSQRFAYLAEIAASLEHPHIVRIFDYGIKQNLSYLVMQYMTGGSLAERLVQPILPSLGEIAALLQQLGSALSYAHENGVIHRDINPSNVMLHDEGLACLSDFGIAELVQETNPTTLGYGAGISTWAYMSPEQWNGERLTSATDQYSLAVLIYLLIAGRLPFAGATPSTIMFKHLHEMPPPLPDVPDAVTAVMEQALAKRADYRFPTVNEFAEAFADAVGHDTGEYTGFFSAPFERKPVPEIVITEHPPAPSYPRMPPVARTPTHKNPLFWAALGAALLVIVLGLVLGRGDDKNAGAENAAMGLPGIVESTETALPPTEKPSGGITGNGSSPNPIILATPTFTETASPLPPTITNTLIPTVPDTPTSTATALPTNTATPTPLPPTNTATASPTNTATLTPSPLPPSSTPSHTPSNTPSNTPTKTATASPSPTALPTNTTVPTAPPTATSAPTRTLMPSATPVITLTACQLADVNGDNRVDIFDIRAISDHYGTASSTSTFEAQYDLDDDGVIGIFDVQIAAAQFGKVCEP